MIPACMQVALAFGAKTLIGAWTTRFVTQRLTTFWVEWARASADWEINSQMWDSCRARAGRPSKACEAAFEAVRRPPVLAAFDEVSRKTHLCGDRPCGEMGWLGICAALLALLLALVVARTARQLADEGLVPAAWRDPRKRICADKRWCEITD